MRFGKCGALLVVVVVALGGTVACEKRARQPQQSVPPVTAAPSPPPRVVDASLPDAGADAALAFGLSTPADKVTIRKVIRAAKSGFEFCYERALLKQPSLAGVVEVEFKIEVDGSVIHAVAKGLTPEVEQCMVEKTRELRFPPSTSRISVRYPFNFKVAP